MIALGLDRECRVPAGTNVVVALLSGMFDDTTVRRSESFNVPRSEDSYRHFGSGQNFYLGAEIAIDHLTEMVGAVLRLPGFQTAEFLRAEYDGRGVLWALAAIGTNSIEFDRRQCCVQLLKHECRVFMFFAAFAVRMGTWTCIRVFRR